MGADRPKQYLTLSGQTLLEHSLAALRRHPFIDKIIVVLDKQDHYFQQLSISQAQWLIRVDGGAQRADSVLCGLQAAEQSDWALVHDAARPCLNQHDLNNLLSLCQGSHGGLLATPVKDTMKRSNDAHQVLHTESRDHLWHALTPQLFPFTQLREALVDARQNGAIITDEASAIERIGGQVEIVPGSATNIKVTHPDDLGLAEYYLQQSRKQQ